MPSVMNDYCHECRHCCELFFYSFSMDAMAALPKDPLIEIFSRVDNIKDLFMFAVTCRWWLHSFTDPAFLHELCRGKDEGHHVHLLGFFF